MERRRKLLAPAIAAMLFACARIANLESANGSDSTSDGGTPSESTSPLVISPLEISFPDVVCGATTATAAPITVTNDTNEAIPYELEIPAGSAFVLRGANNSEGPNVTGTAGAHSKALIEVVLVPPRAAGEFGTDVIFTAKEAVQKVHVTAKITGATLSFTPSLIDFGEVRRLEPIPNEAVELENVGNDPVLVPSFSRTGSTDFGIDGSNITVLPGEKKTLPVKFASGPEGSEQSAEVVPVTDRPTCGPLPKLTLKGTRVNQDILVNPATLNFGDVSCLSDPTKMVRVVTISNYGPLSRSFTVTLPAGAKSAYTAEPMSGFVASGVGGVSKTPITIRRIPGLELGPHPESVVIDVTGAPAAKTASIDVNLVGALLELNPLTMTGVGVNGKTFSVKNTGNRFIAVHHASSDRDFTVTSTSTLNPKETEKPVVRLVATKKGTYTADIKTTRDRGADLCAPATVVAVKGSR